MNGGIINSVTKLHLCWLFLLNHTAIHGSINIKYIRTWLTKLKTGKYFKELIFNTLLFADGQFIISDTEDNLQQTVLLGQTDRPPKNKTQYKR
jgi:hypothetical protein